MSTYNKLKNACVTAGVTGVTFASPSDAESRVVASLVHTRNIAGEIAVIAAFTSSEEIAAYVNYVLAGDDEAPAGKTPAEKAANKAISLLDKAGPSIVDGGAIFTALFGVIRGVVTKCNKQLDKIQYTNARKGAKVAAILAAITVTLAVVNKLTGFITNRLSEHKKEGLKSKESALQKRLDKVKAELDKLEACKKKAEDLK